MHIKLTETFYIESKSVEIVQLFRQDGQSCVQVVLNRHDLCDFVFRCEEANEAWANWQAYMQRVEDNRRDYAEDNKK